MPRVCSCLAAVLALTGSALAASAGLPIPDNPRWQPIVDEVYLQEVGSQIETEEPLLSVAVVDNAAYVGSRRGVFRVEDGTLTPVGGSPADIRRLNALNGDLWAATGQGLWRYADGSWSRVAAGAYVDVRLHLGQVVAASEGHVHSVSDGKLVSKTDSPSRVPILGIDSYSETVYIRHAGTIGFLRNGLIEYEEVQEWGRLPFTSTTRDILALGSRLLVPTNMGLAELRGTTWRTLTGADGLCYEDTTCVAEGFDRDYWVGTTRGAIRAVNGEYHYFGYDRWIPHDKVNAIACGDSVAYIATDGGLGIITYESYTLQKKAAWYKRWLEEWGMKRLGFINTLMYNKDDGTYTRFLSDNDGGWACHYLDALSFEYAVTGDPEVREEAVDVFKSLKWTEEITPIDGYPARAIYAVGEDAIKAATGSAGRPSEWNPTDDGLWEWKGDSSSDEVMSHIFTISLFHDLAAQGTDKEAAKEHLQRIIDHIIENGWCLRDLDGKPTVWARWEPEFIYSPIYTDERGLNSIEALSFVAIANAIFGGQKYQDAKQQLLDWDYDKNALRQKIVFPGYTHFDDRLAFLAYYPLLRYETDPELRATIMRSMQRSWEIKRVENQPWFSYIYGALTGNECENERAVRQLREHPLDCTDFAFTNSHRHDLQVPAGYTNYVVDKYKPMGPREQGMRRWDRNPLDLDHPGSGNILDPSSYLDAYWMGRYYGFIKAPTTTDPNLLDVEKRNVQRGPAPYDGPPRPHIF
jgi:hypothetical protein